MDANRLRLAAAGLVLAVATACGASVDALEEDAQVAAELSTPPSYDEVIDGLKAISLEQSAVAQSACEDVLHLVANVEAMSEEEGVEAVLDIFRQGLSAEDPQFRARVQEAVLIARSDGQAAVVQVIIACANGGYVTPEELEAAARS
jgi:hypothetical protein